MQQGEFGRVPRRSPHVISFHVHDDRKLLGKKCPKCGRTVTSVTESYADRKRRERRAELRDKYLPGILTAMIGGAFLIVGVWLTDTLRDDDPAPAPDRPAQIEPAPLMGLSPIPPG